MPSQERAILDPFAQLSVPESLLVALSGMVIVFIMLAILALVIMLVSRLVGSVNAKNSSDEEEAPKQASPVPTPAPAPAPVAAAVDEGEVIAVMMAAVAEETGMSLDDFRITSVSAVPAAAPVAAAAAAPAAAPAPIAAPPEVPAAPAVSPPAAVSEGATPVNSPMPGNIFKVECRPGQKVKAGDVLVVLEAMKMEIEISAPVDGSIASVAAVVGTAVNTDDLLATIV